MERDVTSSDEMIIRRGKPEDDARIIEILNTSYPDAPPASVETMRHMDAVKPEGAHRERYVAQRRGAVDGYCMLQSRWWDATPGTFSLFVVVDPARRGRSVGSKLYYRALDRARELGVKQLYTTVREDSPGSMGFVTRRGFRPTGHTQRESRLDVAKADTAAFGDVLGRLASIGIRIATLAELGADDEQVLRGVYEVDAESGQDEPGSVDYQAPPFEQWRELIFEPGVSPEWFWVALDGDRPVGMASLRPPSADVAESGLTAVLRAYRGKGVASGLKVAVSEWARERGIRYIYTGNDLTNAPMLAINTKLGFQPLAASVELVKDL